MRRALSQQRPERRVMVTFLTPNKICKRVKREREVPTAIVLTVQRNNANNEPNAQHHDNERVDLEAGALVGVQLEHGRAATAGAGGASA